MRPTLLLVVWFTLPVLVWCASLCVRRRVHPVLVCILCPVTMIAGNFALVHHVQALDAYLLAEVDKYDPDTPEGRRASEEWASDTGRSFVLALSVPLTVVCYTVLFALLFGSQWVIGQLLPPRPISVHAQRDAKTAKQQTDDESSF